MKSKELFLFKSRLQSFAQENDIRFIPCNMDHFETTAQISFDSQSEIDLEEFLHLIKENCTAVFIETENITEDQFNNALKLSEEYPDIKARIMSYLPYKEELGYLAIKAHPKNVPVFYSIEESTELNELIHEILELPKIEKEDYHYELEDDDDPEALSQDDDFSNENNLEILNFKLFQSAENGNLKEIETLVHNGADINSKDHFSQHSLLSYYFDKKGIHKRNGRINDNADLNFIKKLITLGFNIEQSDKDGLTPLKQAIKYNGSKKLIQCLIDCGANVNAIGKNLKRVPLDYIDFRLSDSKEKNEIEKTLLNAGANPSLAKERIVGIDADSVQTNEEDRTSHELSVSQIQDLAKNLMSDSEFLDRYIMGKGNVNSYFEKHLVEKDRNEIPRILNAISKLELEYRASYSIDELSTKLSNDPDFQKFKRKSETELRLFYAKIIFSQEISNNPILNYDLVEITNNAYLLASIQNKLKK